jgi:hypothetical protein
MKDTDKPLFWLRSACAVLSLSIVLTGACRRTSAPEKKTGEGLEIEARLDKSRAVPGEKVTASVVVRSAVSPRRLVVRASLFVPTKGPRDLALRALEPAGKNETVYEAEVSLTRESPEGLYGITVSASQGSRESVGKGSFLVGKVVGDFLIVSALCEEGQAPDTRRYLEDFRRLGGNMVVIHNIISEKAWYPARVCARAAAAGSPQDKVGAALELAEEFGLAVLLSVSWYMTRPMPYAECPKSAEQVLGELWTMFGARPALLGFMITRREAAPNHLNDDQLGYLLSGHYVLVLADIAGMQDTDSLLVKNFVNQGGAVILFGPHILYGDLFLRDELCGGREKPPTRRFQVEAREDFSGRVRKGQKFRLGGAEWSGWAPVSAKAMAAFEDGDAAVLLNRFGQGLVVTIPMSLSDAVLVMPDLLRDMFDYALAQREEKRVFDLTGGAEDMDVAVSRREGEAWLAAVNHDKAPRALGIRPLFLEAGAGYRLTDLKTGSFLREGRGGDFAEIKVSVPGLGYILLGLSKEKTH